MSAGEERLVTADNLWKIDAWLDAVDVYAKPHFDYVNSQLVNTGIKFGNGPTRMTAFIGDTIVRHENGSHTVLSAKDATELAALRARVAELEAERKKYVGVEPTVADELTYVNRCLNAVYAVCDAAEKQATRWEHPLPVPEWVALVRNAADGVTIHAPALPPVPQQRQAEDPHTSPLHHDYALGRDLPAIPHQQDRRAL